MRNVPDEIMTALAADELRPFKLLRLELPGDTVLGTDCDIPLGVLGSLYQPMPWKFGGAKNSTSRIVDDSTLELSNLDDWFTPAFVGGSPRGSAVSISLCIVGYIDNRTEPGYLLLEDGTRLLFEDDSPCALDVGSWGYKRPNATLNLFSGVVDDWSMIEGKINLSIVNKYSAWAGRSSTVHSPSCAWRVFKGPLCRYAGDETYCDRSYSRCAALGNQANFGGFRWLSSLEDKQIWWGATPK